MAEPSSVAPTIPVSELVVSLKVVPLQPSATLYDGWFVLIVEVANPRSEPVWADLEPTGPGSPNGTTFGFRDGPGSPNYTWDDDGRMGFHAGEVKQYAFDINSSGTDWLDGEREVRAFFNSNVAPPVIVRVRP